MGFCKNGLRFREVEESDLAYLRLWRNMPDMAAGWHDPTSVQTPEQQQQWYSSLNRYNQAFIVEDQAVVVGLLRFRLTPNSRNAALTGTDVAPKHQRKGYGQKILRYGAEHVLRDLGYHRVTAEALHTNIAARVIIERAGFRCEGTFREYVWRDGYWQNWHIWPSGERIMSGKRYVIGGKTGALGTRVVDLCGAIPLGRDDEGSDFWEKVGDPFHIINLSGKSHNSMLHKITDDGIESMINANLDWNIRVLRNLRAIFKSCPGSTYTMVGSVTSELGVVGTGVYSATKAALEGLTRVAAHEFAPFARINLLQLGYCDCGMIDQVLDREALVERIPLRRLGNASDVLAAWEFFINCKYVTGAIVNVNGGLC